MKQECWIAAYSKPQAEGRAKWGLEAAHMVVFCPVERLRVKHRDGERYVIFRHLFPRVLFVRCDPGRVDRVLEIDGVSQVLRNNGKVMRVDEDRRAVLQRAEELGMFDKTNESGLKPDDLVRMLDAPEEMRSLVWKIMKGSSRQRMKLASELFSNLTVTTSVDNLERVERVSA